MIKRKKKLMEADGKALGRMDDCTKVQLMTWLDTVECENDELGDFLVSLIDTKILVEQVRLMGDYSGRYVKLFGTWNKLNKEQQKFIEKFSTEYTRPARCSGFYAYFKVENFLPLETI